MSTTRHGISDHQLVEIYERFHQQAKRLGDSDNDANRAALIITYRFGGMTAEQATAAAHKTFPLPQPENTNGQ
jgi:hypothetical protein